MTKSLKLYMLIGWLMAITMVGSTAASEARMTTPGGVAFNELEMKVTQIMDQYIGRAVPGATIAIVQSGKVIFLQGYGLADIEHKRAMDANLTYLEVGSISKLFTWTAVMQLVEQGKLDLDVDVRQYLPPDFIQLAAPITLRHLLTHTAGFEERMAAMMVEQPAALIPLQEYVSARYQPRQIYQPGTIIAYSNYGTNLAGYIIEHVTGMPFAQYINTHIFMPLGMDAATFSQDYNSIPGFNDKKSRGYIAAGNEFVLRPNLYINDMPAGSLQATAENMARFMIAHLDRQGSSGYRLFKDLNTLTKMQTTAFTHNEALPGNAHGFWERFVGAKRVLEHGGNTDSFSASLLIVPEDEFGLCILTNLGSEMSGLRSELINALIGSTYTKPERVEGLDHSRDVAGWYRSARRVESTLFKLFYSVAGSDTHVRAVSPGTITVEVLGQQAATYIETSPYLFERLEAADLLMDRAGLPTSRIYFPTDSYSKVTKLAYGTITDELPVKMWATVRSNQLLLAVNVALVAIGLLWGALVLIGKWRNRKQARGVIAPLIKMNSLLAVLGALLLGLLAIIILSLAQNPFQPLTQLKSLIYLAWLLVAAIVAAIVMALRVWKNAMNPMVAKVLTASLILALGGLGLLLWQNQFFVKLS